MDGLRDVWFDGALEDTSSDIFALDKVVRWYPVFGRFCIFICEISLDAFDAAGEVFVFGCLFFL